MKCIIYDLEWNQPANWENTVTEPVYLSGEIIEIGAVKLDETFRPVDEFKVYISPRYYKKMHNAVAALTGIHDKDLAANGIPFPEAYEKFMAWCGEDCIFMTWSMSDLPVLIDNLVLHGMDPSVLPECCDVQRMFSREIMRGQTRYSLETALALLKETPDTSHDALNDARNTAKVCDHLELEVYLGEYVSKVYGEYPGSTLYEKKSQILADPALQEFTCPWCGEQVRCEPWVNFSKNTYMAYGSCTEGDEFVVQLSLVHHGRQSISTKRILFGLSDDLWDLYMDRKEPVLL